ncbi:MAG TPA: hypothetical protein VKY85_07605 [Candidatus Angelobacter sp.]|nr:hypothetical protein [Candidatus Angelobacter sp.]
MARFAFVGPSYQSQSLNADAQKTLNWYVEQIESGQGKSAMALYPTPGLAVFATLVVGGHAVKQVRGILAIDSIVGLRVFAVGDGTLFEINPQGAITVWGSVTNDLLPVAFTASATQVVIASGLIPYLFDMQANTLTIIGALVGIPISQVGFSDGFFIALQAASQTFYVSSPDNAAAWDLTNFGTVSVFPDVVIAMLVDHREIWLWGATKSVAYYDSGNADFPFDVVPGGYIEQGIIAPASAVRLDNSVFWLGADDRGGGMAWRAQGYSPVRVSNHATETAWAAYPTIADAIGYTYQDQGHSFWVLYFPSANKTWVYDVATQMWHERAFWDAKNAAFTAHRSRCHVYAFGKHLVGDWASGNIYQMSIPTQNGSGWSFADDFGNAIRRIRRAPHISSEQQWTFHHEMQIDLEPGLGPIPPFTQAAIFPATITLQDPNGVLWNVSITDLGAIQTAHGGAAAQVVLLNDGTTANESWQLSISITGVLGVTAVAFSATYAGSYPMASSGTQLLTGLMVNGGVVQAKPPTVYPRDPQIMLRWSDDGGKTWSNERVMNCGQAGNFRTRTIARRLGRSRDRIYEVSASDAIPWRIVDAYLQATPGFAPQERLVSQLRKGG